MSLQSSGLELKMGQSPTKNRGANFVLLNKINKLRSLFYVDASLFQLELLMKLTRL